jgi:hypothetical protein
VIARILGLYIGKLIYFVPLMLICIYFSALKNSSSILIIGILYGAVPDLIWFSFKNKRDAWLAKQVSLKAIMLGYLILSFVNLIIVYVFDLKLTPFNAVILAFSPVFGQIFVKLLLMISIKRELV